MNGSIHRCDYTFIKMTRNDRVNSFGSMHGEKLANQIITNQNGGLIQDGVKSAHKCKLSQTLIRIKKINVVNSFRDLTNKDFRKKN
jgi:hypothetical protein